MKWKTEMEMEMEMEMEEAEVMLEKIWDLHDKLSDAIHSISRTYFHNSIHTLRKKSDENKLQSGPDAVPDNEIDDSFFVVKEFRLDPRDTSLLREAKSLNAIRAALENHEDQLEFFHTIKTQQRAERDAAIARVEQSRIILAMRLSEHHGKKYEVIEEALDFVTDVNDSAPFISSESLCGQPCSPSSENLAADKENKSNMLVKVLFSTFSFAKKSLRLEHLGGIVGNAALVAFSTVAFLHLHQVAYEKQLHQQRKNIYINRSVTKASLSESSASDIHYRNLDVLLARG